MDVNDINNKIESRVNDSDNELVQRMNSLGIKHGTSNRLDKSIKTRTKEDSNTGMISRIRYRFKKEGVFVHKGVGRGGSQNRTAKEWFNPVVEKVASDLAEIAADGMVDITFNRLKIN
jgi:hypothetical protein